MARARSVDVREVPGKGMGMVAARDIAAGEPVVWEAPVVVSPAEDVVGSVCARCLAVLDGPKVACERCSCLYCSADCASKHGEELHPASVCRVLAALDARVTPADEEDVIEVRECARYLAMVSALSTGEARPYGATDSDADDVPARDGQSAFRLLSDLCHGWEGTDEMDGIQRDQAVALFAEVAGDLGSALSADSLAQFLQRRDQNSFGVMMPRQPEEDRQLRGTCIHHLLCKANHSCYPNAARQDYFDDDMKSHRRPPGSTRCSTVYRALQSIPQGQEVSISYTPMDFRVDQRRTHLSSAYGISCSCARCKVEQRFAQEEDDSGEEEQEMSEDAVPEDEEEQEEDEGDDGVPPEAMHHVFTTRFQCAVGCGGTYVPFRLADAGQRAADSAAAAAAAREWEQPAEDAPAFQFFECNTCYHVRSEADFAAAMEADGDSDDHSHDDDGECQRPDA